MSDIMPKVKLYILLSVVVLIISLGVLLTSMANTYMVDPTQDEIDLFNIGVENETIDTGQNKTFYEEHIKPRDSASIMSLGLAFIPFTSIALMTTLDIESNLLIIISFIIAIISAIQTLLLLFFGLQLISNIVYHPDI